MFRLLTILLLALTAPVMAHAENAATEQVVSDHVSFALTASDIEWWEEVDEDHIIPDMLLTLKEKAADELLAVTEQNVGEPLSLYVDGKYIITFLVEDVMADGTVRFQYTNEARQTLTPLLPTKPKKKPVVRIIKTR
ncbi:MAG: hypothetical protein KKA05_06590 [Alphaproteobacteria bacterium]|nr:hypothetical protein [Alphaproteobacteria bacterium]